MSAPETATPQRGAFEHREPLLEVDHLAVDFPLEGGDVRRAVRDVSFAIRPGEITSLVGESGSGKSVTALSLLRLLDPPGRVAAGSIRYEGRDVLRLGRSDLQRLRGDEIAMIFQEPMHSMNPVFTIGRQLTETIRVHSTATKQEARDRAVRWLERVGLPDPERLLEAYPHELSGGMLQRVMIAMALSCNPKLLIADEPTTALDVTIQAQILDLLLDLRDETGLAILFITHDLGVVAEIADTVLVMYAGRVVERDNVGALFAHPSHPYTEALLRTKPVLGRRQRRLPTIPDAVRRLAALDPDAAPPASPAEPSPADDRRAVAAAESESVPTARTRHLGEDAKAAGHAGGGGRGG